MTISAKTSATCPSRSEIVRILATHSVQMLAAVDYINQILKRLESANRRTFWVGAVGVGVTVLSLIVTGIALLIAVVE